MRHHACVAAVSQEVLSYGEEFILLVIFEHRNFVCGRPVWNDSVLFQFVDSSWTDTLQAITAHKDKAIMQQELWVRNFGFRLAHGIFEDDVLL